MKTILFMLAFIAGSVSLYGAASELSPSEVDETYNGYVRTAKQASTSFERNSHIVSDAYRFFCGQNIQNAHGEDYVKGFVEGRYPIEVLYALYCVLKEFFVPETGRFAPEDLNGGFTDYNYRFLQSVFEDGGNS